MPFRSVTAVPERHGDQRVEHRDDGQRHQVQHGEVDHVEQLRVVFDALHDAHGVRLAVRQIGGDRPRPDEARGGVQSTGHPHRNHHHLQHSQSVQLSAVPLHTCHTSALQFVPIRYTDWHCLHTITYRCNTAGTYRHKPHTRAITALETAQTLDMATISVLGRKN